MTRLKAWWTTRGGQTTRNSVLLFVSQIVERITAYGFLLYITRTFGPGLYGRYQVVVTLVGIGGVVCDFGLSNLITKDVAKRRESASAYLAKLLPLKTGLTLGTFCLLLAMTRLLGYAWEVTALVALANLSSFWGLVLGLVGPCLAGYERIDYIVLVRILGSVLTTGLGILALALGLGLWGVFAGSFLVGSLQAALLTWMGRREGMTLRLRLDVRFAMDVLRRATPFGLIGIGLIHDMTAFVILSHVAGPVAVGLYGVARRPLEFLLIVPTSIMGALYPVMASYHQQGSPFFRTAYIRSVHLLLRLVIPIVILCTLLGEQCVVLLAGDAFRPAADAFRLLSWALVLAFLTSPADHVIFAAERTREFLPFFWLKVIVHIGLDLLLIPHWSYMGASVATLLSEVLDFVTHLHFIWLILGSTAPFWSLAGRPLLAGCGMAGVMLALGGQHPFLRLIGGMAVYVTGLWLGWRPPDLIAAGTEEQRP